MPYEAARALSTAKASWDARLREVQRRFPSAADPNWRGAWDYELMGRAIRETIRVDGTPTRRGARPLLEADDGMARFRQLFGEDYTTLDFAEAFRILAGARSLTALARRTGLSRSQVHRLLAGTAPTGREMEMVAQAFGKLPVYFVEYRIGLVCAAMAEHLARVPETSVGLVRQLGLAKGS